MTIKLGIVMDPISAINIKKDSSFAMLEEAQKRGYELFYLEMSDLYMEAGRAFGTMRPLKVQYDHANWFELGEVIDQPLSTLDVILMRKDPPFDTEFIYATYMLERAEDEGCLIVNKPQSLRDANEKLYTAWFAEHTPTTLTYLPAIKDGDKRVLVVDGEPVAYCLARIPAQGETRGNLAAGGRGEARPLSEADWAIARAVGPTLKAKGLIFVGLDIIGDRLTEINVTSPTCIREIEAAFDVSITGMLMDAIERRLGR